MAEIRREQRRPGTPPLRWGDVPQAPSAGETLAKASPQNADPLVCYYTIDPSPVTADMVYPWKDRSTRRL